MPAEYDILVAGGGMVGASLACALAACGYRIAVIEARPFGMPGQPSYDDRTIALAYGSQRILTSLGLWQSLEKAAEPIKSIHISERGRFGAARLHAAEEDVEALGYVVTNRVLGQAMYARLRAQDNIDLIAPATVQDFYTDDTGVDLEIVHAGAPREGEPERVRGRLLVAADGRDSVIRRLAGIEAIEADYGQTAIVANVTPQLPHANVAYERFTDTGPLALLPLGGGRCSLVWTHYPEHVEEALAWNDREFLRRLQERFGYRLGRFCKAGERHAYPLVLVRARRVVATRLALLGNAAHSLHPVAGQGFNLALRDVAVLTDILIRCMHEGTDPGSPDVLRSYADGREADLNRTIRFTDLLARVFTNPWPPVSHGRALGLIAVDLIPPLRHTLARRSMGLAGRLPCLASGRPVEECV